DLNDKQHSTLAGGLVTDKQNLLCTLVVCAKSLFSRGLPCTLLCVNFFTFAS
uniref:Ovule protein n=1 Tax=Mesocestoides corti TaxID=53468 RepID=A0A5K3FG49_MESCO